MKEGEIVGQVGNYWYRESATTYHLHFDLQVPTKYGWVFVNPYMTLVAAYERLIRGRGQELRDEAPDRRPAVGGRQARIRRTAGRRPHAAARRGRKADRNKGRIAGRRP